MADLIGLDFWKVVDVKNKYGSFKSLCDKVGLNAQSMYNLRSRNLLPCRENVIRIAHALGMSESTLLFYIKDSNDPYPDKALDIKEKLNKMSPSDLNIIRRFLGLPEQVL